MAYFAKLYQAAVMKHLQESGVGLSRNYKDWPGGSQIIIPLTDKAELKDVRSLDTTVLADEKVVEELQKKEDKGIEDRKQLVEIKEKEVEQTERDIKEESKQVEEQKSAIEEKEKEIAQEREAIQKKEKDLEKEKAAAETLTDETEKKETEQEIEKKEEEIVAARAEIVDKESEVEKQKEEVAAREREIETEQTKAEEKREEIAEDKKEIAKDERVIEVTEAIKEDPEKAAEELIQKEEELKKVARRDPVTGGFLYYLKVKEYLTDGHYANDLYRIDAVTGEYISKAPDKPHIAGHKYDIFPERGVLVLTQGETREAHYLTLLDLITLVPINTSNVDIFHKSFIERRGDFIYAVNFKYADNFRLGKYDADSLELIAESEVKIDKNTIFHMSGDLIFVGGPDGSMQDISAADLALKNTIDLP